MSSDSRLATLFVQRSSKQHELAGFATSLGRTAGNDIVLPADGFVSRQHAVILYFNGEFYIQDLNSKNGTLLNGQQLESLQPVRLKSGDHITLGMSVLTFLDLQSERTRRDLTVVADTHPIENQRLPRMVPTCAKN